MKCLETRQRNGMRWRRYRMPDGVIWTTYEVPINVVAALGPKALQAELERATRRLKRLQRNAKAVKLLGEGTKPIAVANEVGISESMARRLRLRKRET